jgi:hypothetical protein
MVISRLRMVFVMKWDEVRKIYPDKFVKIQILESHMEGNIRHIDDMAVIKAFDDNKDATRELVRAKDDILVYHTGKDKIEVEIKQIFGYRGVI